MPLPGRTLFEPLRKAQIPLIKASCSPGAYRSLELPLTGGKAPTFLAMLSGLTPSRISSFLTLITQGLFLPMTVWLWMAHQKMYHLHSPNPFWSFRQRECPAMFRFIPQPLPALKFKGCSSPLYLRDYLGKPSHFTDMESKTQRGRELA